MNIERLIILGPGGSAIGYLDYLNNKTYIRLLTQMETDELFRLVNSLVADKLLIAQEEYVELD